MKFKRLFLCLAALLLCAATASANTLFVNTQNGKTVNMRSGAGTKYKILRRVPNGYAVETEDELDPDGWLLCTYEGRQGYINGQYLSEAPGAINGYVVSGYMATAMPTETGGYVNLLEKPSKNAKVICKCYEGDELIVLRSNGTWSLVYATGSCDRGFVQSDFLKFKDEIELSEITLLLADTISMIPATGKTTSTATSSHSSSGSSQDKAEMVYCELCGGWYEAGNVFRNHICSGKQPEMVQCDLCGGWYEAGNEFRNHICSGRSDPEPEMVYCELCGGWYEAGNVFRNHICSGRE